MASTSKILLIFAFSLISISLTSKTLAAARNIPTDNDDDKWLGHFDRSVLIPGFGRVMLPKKGDKSLDYNPVTGTHGGKGASIPSVGGSTRHNYVPRGDDTFAPGPSMVVPNPTGGAGVPSPSGP